MDCLQAAEVLSAAHDGELLDAAQLQAARQHCASCAHCRAMEQLLGRVSELQGPRTPDSLVASIAHRAAAVAAEVRHAAADVQADDALPVPAHKHPQRANIGLRWVTAFAGTAAVLLVAMLVGTMVLANGPQKANDEAATIMLSEESGSDPEGTAAPESAQDDALRATAQPAPAYVVFDGGVWILSEGAPAASVLTTAGAVTSDLGSGTPATRHAYTSDADGDPLYVRSEGGYVAFTRVVRSVGRAEYQLRTDQPVELFGQWPALPSRIPVPESSDGSPVFRKYGFDDRNVDLYALIPHGIEGGFAVAPGTTTDDPAAGNPNWTWWEKLP